MPSKQSGDDVRAAELKRVKRQSKFFLQTSQERYRGIINFFK